jgi:hypothetical protein
MTNDDRSTTARPTGRIPDGDTPIELPSPKTDPGFAATDDHIAGAPLGLGHQPDDDLDPGVDPEHILSPSQGVKIERG